MKTYLFFPPTWGTSYPYLSLPCLSASMQKNNIDFEEMDLNLLSFDFFSSNYFIDYCMQKIKTKKNLDVNLLFKYTLIMKYLKEKSNQFKKTMTNLDDFINFEKYIHARCYIEELYNFISVSFDNIKIASGSVSSVEWSTIENVNNYIGDDDNPFYLFYSNALKSTPNIDIACISLSATSQIVPVLILCKVLKMKNNNMKIILGGNPFTKISDRINELWLDWFKCYFDIILLHEGESSLCEAINIIKKKKNYDDIPNAIYLEKNCVIKSSISPTTLKLNELPTPRFNSKIIKNYLSPHVILPYYITRGCYWKKCSFCDHDFGYDPCYRTKCIDRVIEDIMEFKNKYNVEIIAFVDEAIPPKYIKEFANIIIKNNIKISWTTCIRASFEFDDNLCKLMKESGCEIVYVGVESCSQKILDSMNKGITINEINSTLKHMKNNNIWAHAFLINDYEGETSKEKLDTLVNIIKNKDIFPSCGLSSFTLSKNAKMYNNCDYGENIEYISDFSNDLTYKQKWHSSDDELNALRHIYNKFNYTSLFFSNFIIEREHIIVFLKEVPLIRNEKFLNNKIKKVIDYNFSFILYTITDNCLLIYNLLNRKTFTLPLELEELFVALSDLKDLDDILQYLKDHYQNNYTEFYSFLVNNLFEGG